MLMIGALIIGGIITLFVVLSLIGLITPVPDDQDAAASGLIQRH